MSLRNLILLTGFVTAAAHLAGDDVAAIASHPPIRVDVEQVSGVVDGALEDVLRELGRQGGFDVAGRPGSTAIRIAFEHEPLTAALSRLLWQRSYVLHFDRTGRLRLLRLLDDEASNEMPAPRADRPPVPVVPRSRPKPRPAPDPIAVLETSFDLRGEIEHAIQDWDGGALAALLQREFGGKAGAIATRLAVEGDPAPLRQLARQLVEDGVLDGVGSMHVPPSSP